MLQPLPHFYTNGPIDEDIRTEDVRFSPSGRRVVVASTDGSLHLFAVEPSSRPLEVTYQTRLVSSELLSPHGVEFLSEDAVAVANRHDTIRAFRVPLRNTWDPETEIDRIGEMDSDWFGAPRETRRLRERSVATGPGAVRRHGRELLVCCNKLNTVTAHTFALGENHVSFGAGRIVAQDGLEIPDGLAVSHDGAWLAVSDHDNNRILVYRLADGTLSCALMDDALKFPHGLCFDRTGNFLLSADAGNRFIHVFQGEGGWMVDQTRSEDRIDAVPLFVFDRTQSAVPEAFRPLEGGSKGIDIDPSGRLVAITCRHLLLRVFLLDPAFA